MTTTAAVTTTSTATTTVLPPGRLNLPRWGELWHAREVAFRMAQRDILVRYRQTVLGVGWVVIQPLMSAGVFTLVFGKVAGFQGGVKIPFFLFSLAGSLVWTVFSGTLTRAAAAMVGNQSLVSKVYFPRLLVPLSTVASVLLDFAVGLVLAIGLLFYWRINPGWPVLLVPVWALLAAMLGLGVGVAASALMVKYRDVGYVLPWVTQVLLYASPVAYPLSSVPASVRVLFDINPATWFLEAFRWSLTGMEAPPAWQMIGLAVGAPLVLLLGVLWFQRYEREFADVI
ncbi:MAG TPA: ABC transporter permease [Cellulomonas sp.]